MSANGSAPVIPPGVSPEEATADLTMQVYQVVQRFLEEGLSRVPDPIRNGVRVRVVTLLLVRAMAPTAILGNRLPEVRAQWERVAASIGDAAGAFAAGVVGRGVMPKLKELWAKKEAAPSPAVVEAWPGWAREAITTLFRDAVAAAQGRVILAKGLQ